MPIDPELPERLARAVYGIAGRAELEMVRLIATRLAAGLGSPDWADQKLSALSALLRQLDTLAGEMLLGVRSEAASAVQQAAAEGVSAAGKDVGAALGRVLTARVLPGADALAILLAESLRPLDAPLAAMRGTILRTTQDAYRSVVADVAGRVLLGTGTRRQAAQEALNRFARAGVSGFTDRAGRRWDLASYAEMATRTAAQRAMVSAHTAALEGQGVRLVMVSNAPQECARCRPWEGKVLSLGPGAGPSEIRATNPAAGEFGPLVTVHVAGTLAEATAAGLFHPNCRHSVGAYLPGLTKPLSGRLADPEGDAARQRLRALERQLRAWKRVEAAALDDQAAARPRAAIRATQAAIREHVASTSAKRQPQRERIGVAR